MSVKLQEVMHLSVCRGWEITEQRKEIFNVAELNLLMTMLIIFELALLTRFSETFVYSNFSAVTKDVKAGLAFFSSSVHLAVVP